jgi:hypothetical protein
VCGGLSATYQFRAHYRNLFAYQLRETLYGDREYILNDYQFNDKLIDQWNKTTRPAN